MTRPVWAEVSLERLAGNFNWLRRQAATSCAGAPPELLAVVKADAYGHGVQLCGPALAAAGAGWLGVTSVEEGATLRRALGVLPSHLSATRILVMSSLWHGEAETLLDRALTPQVWEPYQLAMLTEAATRRLLPAASVAVHLEIDTGMARQGITPGPRLDTLLSEYFAPRSPLLLEGIMTHFSAPEERNKPDTSDQIDRFRQALQQLAAASLRPRWLHAGNSATLFDAHHVSVLAGLAESHGAQLMLRPGLALYGYPVRFLPALPGCHGAAGLQPVLAWKTRITSLRDLAAGRGAGYNSVFRANRPTRLALVPVGYADGLNRLLSNPVPTPASAMLVHGQRAPIAGRISMDQTILDVTDIPGAAIGDEVVILGEQGNEHLSAWDQADLCGTIPYEVLCNIAGRVPRTVVD